MSVEGIMSGIYILNWLLYKVVLLNRLSEKVEKDFRLRYGGNECNVEYFRNNCVI